MKKICLDIANQINDTAKHNHNIIKKIYLKIGNSQTTMKTNESICLDDDISQVISKLDQDNPKKIIISKYMLKNVTPGHTDKNIKNTTNIEKIKIGLKNNINGSVELKSDIIKYTRISDTGKRIYYYNDCGWEFKNKSNRIRHIKTCYRKPQ